MAGVYDLDQAKQKVTDYSTQKYGRGPQNDQEWASVGQGINYGDGVDDNELTQAYGNVDTYAKSLGAQPTSQAAPAQPTAQPQAQSPIQDAFQSSLTSLFQRAQAPVSLSDPNLQPRADVFAATRQRAAERERAALAERSAATGTLGSGGFDAGVGQILARQGLDEANFNANLVGSETDARRQELLEALRIAAQSRGLDLQQMLGTGDLDLRRLGINQQGQLGRGDLSLRYLLGQMGNQQFYDQLGTQNAQWLADYNQRAFSNYMGLI